MVFEKIKKDGNSVSLLVNVINNQKSKKPTINYKDESIYSDNDFFEGFRRFNISNSNQNESYLDPIKVL